MAAFISKRGAAGLALAISSAAAFQPASAALPVTCVNCAQFTQVMATNQILGTLVGAVNTQTTTLKMSTDQSASAIVSELNAHLAGVGQLTDGLAVSFRQTMRQHQAANEAAEAQRNYGYGSEEYELDGVVHRPTGQPLTLCSSSARAEMIGQSTSTREGGMAATSQEMGTYNSGFSDVRSTTARYDELPDESYDAGLVLGDDASLTADQQELADEWVKTVTNPLPQPKLPERVENSSAGRAYERSRKILNSELKPSQDALGRLKSDKSMTVPLADDIRNKWAAIDPSKEIASEDGNVSPLTVLRTEIDYRYASKEWTDRLVDLQPRAATIELLQMKAIEMKMDYERYQLERYRTALLAINSSREARAAAEDEVTRQRRVATGQVPPGGSSNGGASNGG